MHEKKTRGYDDDVRLTEMALGIVTQEYKSVDEAARSVIGDAHPSNAERLRRKFRDQNWYKEGLRLYVEAELQKRTAEIDTNRDGFTAASATATTPVASTMARVLRWMRLPAAGAAFGSLALLASYQIAPTSAAIDPDKVERAERAEQFATSAVKAIYSLTFVDPAKQMRANERFFLTRGAYDEYVKDLMGRRLPMQVQRNLLVLRNEVVSDPMVGEIGEDLFVRFKMQQVAVSGNEAKTTCQDVQAFVNPNPNSGFGAAEFGLMGPPRLTPVECP